MEQYRVVETDNYGGDYPDEKWRSEWTTKQEAERIAEEWNEKNGNGEGARYAKVVKFPYELQPGFRP